MKILAVLFGSLSAALWIASSFIPLPRRIWTQARVGEGGPSPDLDLLAHRLRWQSRLNAAAAFCAAIAAGAQAFA